MSESSKLPDLKIDILDTSEGPDDGSISPKNKPTTPQGQGYKTPPSTPRAPPSTPTGGTRRKNLKKTKKHRKTNRKSRRHRKKV